MAIDDDIQLFAKVSLFQGFALEHLRLLAFGSEHLALRAGRDLYRESQVADCGFVVASGDIELHSETETGRKSHGSYRRGALLGEFAMIAPGRRLCHATATAESEVIRISRAAFMRVLGEYPDVALTLHRRVAGDLRGLVEKVGRLGPSFLE